MIWIIIYAVGVLGNYLYVKRYIRRGEPVDDWLELILHLLVNLTSWVGVLYCIWFHYQDKYNIRIKPPKWF